MEGESAWVPVSITNAVSAEEDPFVAHAVPVPIKDISRIMGSDEMVELRNALFVSIVVYKKTEVCDEPRHVFLHHTLDMEDSILLRNMLWREIMLVLTLTKPVTMKTLPIWSHILRLHTMSMGLVERQQTLQHHLQLMQAAIHLATNHMETVDNVHALMAFFQRKPKDTRDRDAADKKYIEDLRKGREHELEAGLRESAGSGLRESAGSGLCESAGSGLRESAGLRETAGVGAAAGLRETAGVGAAAGLRETGAAPGIHLFCHNEVLFDPVFCDRTSSSTHPCAALASHLSLLLHGCFLAFATNLDRFQDVITSAQNVALKFASLINHLEIEEKMHENPCEVTVPKCSPSILEYEANANALGIDTLVLREVFEKTMADVKLSRSSEASIPSAMLWVSAMQQFVHIPAAYAMLSIFLEFEVRQLLHPVTRTVAAVLFVKNMICGKSTSSPQSSHAHRTVDFSRLMDSVMQDRPILSVSKTRFVYDFVTMGTKKMAHELLQSSDQHILHHSLLPCDPLKIITKLPFLGSDPLLALDSVAHFDNIFRRHTMEFPMQEPVPLRLRFASRLAFFGVVAGLHHIAGTAPNSVGLLFNTRYTGTLEGLVLGAAFSRTAKLKSGHLGNIGTQKPFLQDAPAADTPSIPPGHDKPFWKLKVITKERESFRTTHHQLRAAELPILDFEIHKEPSIADILDTVFGKRVNPDIVTWLKERGYTQRHTEDKEQEPGHEDQGSESEAAAAAAAAAATAVARKVAVMPAIKTVMGPQNPQIVQMIDGCVEEGFIFMDDIVGFRMLQDVYLQLCIYYNQPFLQTVLLLPGLHQKGRSFVDSRNPKYKTLQRKQQVSGYVVPFVAVARDKPRAPTHNASLGWLPGFAALTMPETIDFGIPCSSFDFEVNDLHVHDWMAAAVLRELNVLGLKPTVWPETQSAKHRAFSIRVEPAHDIFPLITDESEPLDTITHNFFKQSATIKFINNTRRLAGGNLENVHVIVTRHTKHAYLVAGKRHADGEREQGPAHPPRYSSHLIMTILRFINSREE